MKTTDIRIAGIVAVFFLAAANCFAAPPAVNAEPMDLDADLVAKIGKEKTKQAVAQNAAGAQGKSAGAKGDCGTVNINSNEQKSNSGIKDMFGKQSTTIVTGPVINMANCK